MGRAIGIDLGTTNTAVAVLKDGRPLVLEDEKGYKVLPSTVSLKDDGKFVVGQAARALLLTRPEYTVYAIKRLMGRRYDSPEVEAIRQRLPFTIHPAPDGTCLVGMGDQFFTPVEVSALILQVARSIAERALGEKVDEAVITVPAYFNHAQRAATFEAARIAGLKCERLLNEPTAAALAYGFRKDVERTLVIYDLGGGTFDVSVLRLSAGIYEILSTRGDSFLGGEDFDHRLMDHLANHFEDDFKVDLREDRTTLQRLKDAAERAKCELSFTDRTTVLIPRVTPTQNLEQVVSRLTLETLVEDLVQRTLEIVRTAVAEAGLKVSDVDDVILVGGQTRMPRVREAVAALFKKEPARTVHPEEAVAVGAAVHASSLGAADGRAPVLLDVTPFDLGIDVAGGLFQPVIMRNSQIPTAHTRSFATVQDNQEAVRVTVRQGFSRVSAENEFLGEFVLSGLTPAPRMQTKVDVTFRMDTNGMLHVMAVEPATGERKRITVRNYAEVVASKESGGFDIEGDVLRGPLPVPVAAPLPLPVEESRAAPAAAAPAGRGGRIASFFGRMARRRKGAEGPAAPAPVEEIQDLHAADLEALPDEAVAAAAEAAAAQAASRAATEGLEVGTLRAVRSPEPDSVSVATPGKRRIVLPDVRGLVPSPETARPSLAVEPPAEEHEEEADLDHAAGTVAVFGLAGESPSFERPVPPSPMTNASVVAGPLTRGPPLEPGSEGQAGKWDFGLDIAEDLGDDEDFERLFHALERGGATSSTGPAEGSESNPTLMPLDTPPPRLREGPSTPAPVARGKVIPPSGPPTPAQVPSRRAGAAPGGPPSLAPATAAGPGGGDPRGRAPGQSEEPRARGAETRAAAEERARAAEQAIDELKESLGGGDLDDLFALADDLFSAEEAPAPPRAATPPPRPAPVAPAAPTPAPVAAPRPPAAAPSATPAPVGEPAARKAARLKLAYPRMEALVAEYRENLRRGGCFVRTDQPLAVGREVRIEVRAPGLSDPLELSGVVTAAHAPADGSGQPAGMTIEYRLSAEQRGALERLVGSARV